MKLKAQVAAIIYLITFATIVVTASQAQSPAFNRPLRIAAAGATHGHVPWILRRNKPDAILVGIFEPDIDLSARLAKQYNLPPGLFYTNLNQMLATVKPVAVVAFGSIYEHKAVVQACAPMGIHVMVEKPLATNLADAEEMAALARKNNIYLLTNFETSWYPTTAKTYQLVNDSSYVGKLRKVVIHDGHNGPKEIGVNPEFFKWLTDPVQNGGGALIDFGCYGANLMTYLMKGGQPVSVTAVTRQFKPSVYPKVDDDATIIVDYPSAQCIIQASWNWPFSRKDMEVYGETGYVFADNNTDMRMKNQRDKIERKEIVSADALGVYTDPFSYLANVVSGRIKEPQFGLYSLETNIIVVKILDAARRSAQTGKTVLLK